MIEAQLFFDLIIVLLIAAAYIRIANLRQDITPDKTGADFATDLIKAVRIGGMELSDCADCGELFVRPADGGQVCCWNCSGLEPKHECSEIEKR